MGGQSSQAVFNGLYNSSNQVAASTFFPEDNPPNNLQNFNKKNRTSNQNTSSTGQRIASLNNQNINEIRAQLAHVHNHNTRIQ